MPGKRYSAEPIVAKLREADEVSGQRQTITAGLQEANHVYMMAGGWGNDAGPLVISLLLRHMGLAKARRTVPQ
jgi:hypothetical protein